MKRYTEIKKKEGNSKNYEVWGVYDTPSFGLPVFDNPNRKAIDVSNLNQEPQTGDVYNPDTGTFEVTPTLPKYEINVTLDKTIIQSDGVDEVKVTIMIKKDKKTTKDYDGIKFYIPILDIDETKKELLNVTLLNGEKTIPFSTTEKGLYTTRLDLLRDEQGTPIIINLTSVPLIIAE